MTTRTWGEHLTLNEQIAMEQLGVDPGFNDFSSDVVLEAYRKGRKDMLDDLTAPETG